MDQRFLPLVRRNLSGRSWIDRLHKGKTFKDWNIHRPQIRIMTDTRSLPVEEEDVSVEWKRTLEDTENSSQWKHALEETSSSSPTDKPQISRLRTRVLLVALGALSLLALLIPIIVILTLPKLESDDIVSTVEVEVTILQMEYTAALNNKESQEYRNFTVQFCNEIEKQYNNSELKEVYDGCAVTKISNGSIKVAFLVVFVSKEMPTSNDVKSALNLLPVDTGQGQATLGVFIIEVATVSVGKVTNIDVGDNPSPRLEFGEPCRVTQSCKTFQAECIGKTCACAASRNYQAHTDACILPPSSTRSTTATTPSTTTATTPSTTPVTTPLTTTVTTPSTTTVTDPSTWTFTTPSTTTVTTESTTTATTASTTTVTTPFTMTATTPSTTTITTPLTTTVTTPSTTTATTPSTTTITTPLTTTVKTPSTTTATTPSTTTVTTPLTTAATTPSTTTVTTPSTTTATTLSTTTITTHLTTTVATPSDTTTTTASTTPVTSPSTTPVTSLSPTPVTTQSNTTNTTQSTTMVTTPSTTTVTTPSTTTATTPSTPTVTTTSSTTITTPFTRTVTTPSTTTATTPSTTTVTTPSTTTVTTPSSTTVTTPSTTTATTPSTTTVTTPSTTTVTTPSTRTVTTPSTTTVTTSSSTTTVTSTTPSTPMTTSPIDFMPVIKFFGPSSSGLEIGEVDRLVCEVRNVSDWNTIVLEKTSAGVKELIGSVTKTDGTWESNYGSTSGSHMFIYLEGDDIKSGANVTLLFNPVQCGDAATYHCSAAPPGRTTTSGEISVALDVFKPPSLTFDFPDVLLDGIWSHEIGCSAYMGFPGGVFTLVLKYPNEDTFSPFSESDTGITKEETEDPEYSCIKTVSYKFDRDLDSWNMTQIRCGINVGMKNEILSEVGVFQIVPRAVCNGKESENIPYPFNCKLFITCSTNNAIWGNVYNSSCADDECWLADGQCRTTTTAAITTTPSSASINCKPKSLSALVGDVASFTCSLWDIETVTDISIPQFEFREEDENGINGNFTIRQDVILEVILTATGELVLHFRNVVCDLEGEITVIINTDISDNVALKIRANPVPPALSMPDSIYRNQETSFQCSANLGRLPDGTPASVLTFQIKQKGSNDTMTLGQGLEILSNSSDNCQNHVTVQLKLVTSAMISDAELNCVLSDVATQTYHLSASSGPITLLEPNIFFDTDFKYDAIIGETLQFTCTFREIADVQSMTVTRGSTRETVITVYRDGREEQPLSRFSVNKTEWASDTGSVKINLDVQCGDESVYYCAAADFVSATFITVLKRPEKPSLSLSNTLVEGQESADSQLSECKGELGVPAGDLVVELLIDGTFTEYDVILAEGYPMDIRTDCGTNRTIQFYFEDLSSLNNTEIRCIVKTAGANGVDEVVLSDVQVIQVISGSYCDGINSSFHIHPYDCHYYIDCEISEPDSLRFTRCTDPDSCPNDQTGCDIDSCSVLCDKDAIRTTTTAATTTTTATTTTALRSTTQLPEPYLTCNETVQAGQHSSITLYCEAGNTDMVSVTIYRDNNQLFSENASSGTSTSEDGSITLTYSQSEIRLDISDILCVHNGVYTIAVNDVLRKNITLIFQTNPGIPTITASRFVLTQEASVECQGGLGNPIGSQDVYIEALLPGATEFMPVPLPTVTNTQFNDVNCTFVRTAELTFTVVVFLNGVPLRCRTTSETGTFTSPNITVNITAPEVEIYPETPSGAIGEALSIQCNVTGVSQLTSMRLYHASREQVICQIIGDVVTSYFDGNCSGESTATNGHLQADFSSLQCTDKGDYICECNTEATTPKTWTLEILRSPTKPSFTSVPMTLIENMEMAEDESFRCEGELGYLATGSLIFQANKTGQFEKYDFDGANKTRSEGDCSIIEKITVKLFAFDMSWRNSQLRCVILNEEGNVTDYVSEELAIQLIPENYCEGQDEYSLHPYDIHLYIRCTGNGLNVTTCNEECPVLSDGGVTCDTCQL